MNFEISWTDYKNVFTKKVKVVVIPIADTSDYIEFVNGKRKRVSNKSELEFNNIENAIVTLSCHEYNLTVSANIEYYVASNIPPKLKGMTGCFPNPNSGALEQSNVINHRFHHWFNKKFKTFKKRVNFSVSSHGVKPHESGNSVTYLDPICKVITIIL